MEMAFPMFGGFGGLGGLDPGFGGLGGILGGDDPFFSGIERAMDRAFARAVDDLAASASGGTSGETRAAGRTVANLFRTVGGGTPMDIFESDDEYYITTDAPGFTPEEVTVEEHEGVLTMRGTKPKKRREFGKLVYEERGTHTFNRSFTLPDTADAKGISASMDRGVLTVHIPKVEAARTAIQPRKIPIAEPPAKAAKSSLAGDDSGDAAAAKQHGGESAMPPPSAAAGGDAAPAPVADAVAKGAPQPPEAGGVDIGAETAPPAEKVAQMEVS